MGVSPRAARGRAAKGYPGDCALRSCGNRRADRGRAPPAQANRSEHVIFDDRRGKQRIGERAASPNAAPPGFLAFSARTFPDQLVQPDEVHRLAQMMLET